MKTSLVKVMLVIAIVLVWMVTHVKTIFPVELIRVVFSTPSTIAVDSVGLAWFVVGLTIKVVLIGFYLGLPRDPPRRPVRGATEDFDLVLPFDIETLEERIFTTASYIDSAMDGTEKASSWLQTVSKLDEKDCIARLLCHLQSKPDEELTDVQKIVLKVLWMSATPSWNYSSIKSPRNKLINALNFGKITSCFHCCQLVYKTCTVATETLLRVI